MNKLSNTCMLIISFIIIVLFLITISNKSKYRAGAGGREELKESIRSYMHHTPEIRPRKEHEIDLITNWAMENRLLDPSEIFHRYDQESRMRMERWHKPQEPSSPMARPVAAVGRLSKRWPMEQEEDKFDEWQPVDKPLSERHVQFKEQLELKETKDEPAIYLKRPKRVSFLDKEAKLQQGVIQNKLRSPDLVLIPIPDWYNPPSGEVRVSTDSLQSKVVFIGDGKVIYTPDALEWGQAVRKQTSEIIREIPMKIKYYTGKNYYTITSDNGTTYYDIPEGWLIQE